MTVSESLGRVRAILAAAAPAASLEVPTSRSAVASLASALRPFGPFEQVGWALLDDRASTIRLYLAAVQTDGPQLLPWGLELSAPAPLVLGETRSTGRQGTPELPAVALLEAGCAHVVSAPLRPVDGRLGWFVAGWRDHSQTLDEETLAALDALGYVAGPSILRALRRASVPPPSSGRNRPALPAEHARQIAIAGRWAAIGTLAGGVVHEINNPATFIALAAGQIDKGLAGGLADLAPARLAQLHELTSGIQDATKQIRGLVGDFRQFVGGAGKSAMLTVDLERVLLAAAAMTKAAHRHDAVLETDVQPIPPCPGNLLALGPATVNLLVNGIESLGDGPRARRVSLRAVVLGDSLEIVVSDTGAGIAPEDLPRVFDPFFTTKSSEIHAGIGLTVARSAVEGLGGTIRVESELGVGTTVVVTVPMP